jgi:hypothetical protein
VGEAVMEALRQLDDVAYVRFASVYRNFREAKDFETVLGELSGEDDGKSAAARNERTPRPLAPTADAAPASRSRRDMEKPG